MQKVKILLYTVCCMYLNFKIQLRFYTVLKLKEIKIIPWHNCFKNLFIVLLGRYAATTTAAATSNKQQQ